MNTVSADLARPFSPSLPEGFTWERRFDTAFPETAPAQDVLEARAHRFAGFLPDGRIAAVVNVTEICRGPFQSCHIGWSANVEVAGHAYVSEAVRAVLDLAFAAPGEGLGLHRVQAGIMPRNLPSLRVAERCGFRREGLAPEYLEIAGVWEDHLLFALVSTDPRPPLTVPLAPPAP